MVKYPQTWSHSVLQFEFVSQNVQFKDLTFNIFVAGECEILTSKHISKKEFKGRLKLSKKNSLSSEHSRLETCFAVLCCMATPY